MPKEALTIALDAGLKADLDRMALTQGRNRDTLIDEAITSWLDLQAWQAAEIRAGLKAAEAGDFATEEEVEAAFGRR